MKLLLDTHAFLWWCFDDPNLKTKAREIIAKPDSIVFVSAASIWEISIKTAQRRLSVPDSPSAAIDANGFIRLSIDCEHAEAAAGLAQHHSDPFDRMLIAQARLESLTIVTSDRMFESYGTDVLWT